MRGIIRNIIAIYQMRAEALSVLVANTQRAFEEFGPDRETKANEQRGKLQNFVNDLTSNVNDMFTKFWFQKEHRQRNHEQMTDDEVKNLADFANFAETLAKDIRSLLIHFEDVRGQQFEECFDKEAKRIETCVEKRLKEFEKTLNGTKGTLKNLFSKHVCNRLSSIGNSVRCKLPSNELSINGADSSNEKQEFELRL